MPQQPHTNNSKALTHSRNSKCTTVSSRDIHRRDTRHRVIHHRTTHHKDIPRTAIRRRVDMPVGAALHVGTKRGKGFVGG